MGELSGRHVAVIGGSSGMGFAIAAHALRKGARVTIGSANAARGKSAAERLGGSAAAAAVDLGDPEAVSAFARGLGAVDHLVVTAQSAAAVTTMKPLAGLDFAAAEKAVAIKLLGTLRAVAAIAPALARDGSVILFSGAASRRIIPGHAVLGAVNAAIEAAGRQLAKELAPVRVNVISPGLVRTEAYDAMPAEQREAMFAARAKALPVGRIGSPDDVATAAIHLMVNGYVTGTVQDIDGGGLLG